VIGIDETPQSCEECNEHTPSLTGVIWYLLIMVWVEAATALQNAWS